MKNNIVIDTQNHTVTKQFRSKIACAREAQALHMLEGSGLAPALITADTNSVTMSLCPGRTLSEVLPTRSESGLIRLFEQLTDWFVALGQTCSGQGCCHLALEDVNLKNFLYEEESDHLTGIDLEAWHPGELHENFAALLAMIATTTFREDIRDVLYRHIHDYILLRTNCDDQLLTGTAARIRDAIRLRRSVMPHLRRTDCVILAGGRSSRMGQPKALLPWREYTFLDHIIHTTRIFDRLYLSANSPEYKDFRCEIIPDIHRDIGPLGAIHAALTRTEGEWVFLLPCDMPLIRQGTIFHLFRQADWEADCNIARTTDHTFPTVGLYHKRMLSAVEQQIADGNYRLMFLLNHADTHYIEISPEHEQAFSNINTKEDYQNITV